MGRNYYFIKLILKTPYKDKSSYTVRSTASNKSRALVNLMQRLIRLGLDLDIQYANFMKDPIPAAERKRKTYIRARKKETGANRVESANVNFLEE